jgi:hypothetical protein
MGGYKDISVDPQREGSDHESDDEPSTVGYNDYDTDEERSYAAVAMENRVLRTEQNVSIWCRCGNCVTMESDIEC